MTEDKLLSENEGAGDGLVLPILFGAIQAAIDRGLTVEVAIETTCDAFIRSMPRLIDQIAGSLHRGKMELSVEMARERQVVAAAIGERWGQALATYEVVLQVTHELGVQMHAVRHLDDASGEASGFNNDDEMEVWVDPMSLLHGRAYTVAEEVLCLLWAGFPDGALARQRTLHELAVVITLITENQEFDLLSRYIDYSIVEQREDMLKYQTHAAALNYEPLSREEVEGIERQYEEVLQRYGTDFRKRYRWAAPLFPPGRDITFTELEEKAGLGHLRPFYRHANHTIHAGPRAAVLNFHTDYYPWSVGAGARADANIAEIGHGALISLLQCTVPLATNLPEELDRPDFLVQAQVLMRLVENAGVAFYRAARAAGLTQDCGSH